MKTKLHTLTELKLRQRRWMRRVEAEKRARKQLLDVMGSLQIDPGEAKLFLGLNDKTELSDALELILRVKGPLKAQEILRILRAHGVRIKGRNTGATLVRTIVKDQRRRFEVFKDNRISLTQVPRWRGTVRHPLTSPSKAPDFHHEMFRINKPKVK